MEYAEKRYTIQKTSEYFVYDVADSDLVDDWVNMDDQLYFNSAMMSVISLTGLGMWCIGLCCGFCICYKYRQKALNKILGESDLKEEEQENQAYQHAYDLSPDNIYQSPTNKGKQSKSMKADQDRMVNAKN